MSDTSKWIIGILISIIGFLSYQQYSDFSTKLESLKKSDDKLMQRMNLMVQLLSDKGIRLPDSVVYNPVTSKRVDNWGSGLAILNNSNYSSLPDGSSVLIPVSFAKAGLYSDTTSYFMALSKGGILNFLNADSIMKLNPNEEKIFY